MDVHSILTAAPLALMPVSLKREPPLSAPLPNARLRASATPEVRGGAAQDARLVLRVARSAAHNARYACIALNRLPANDAEIHRGARPLPAMQAVARERTVPIVCLALRGIELRPAVLAEMIIPILWADRDTTIPLAEFFGAGLSPALGRAVALATALMQRAAAHAKTVFLRGSHTYIVPFPPLNPEYAEMARRRIVDSCPMFESEAN